MTRERWVAFVAGLAFVAGGIALGAGPYADRLAFEKAGYCGTSPPAAREGCVARVPMTVVSRRTYTTEDPDPNWPPPQPPQPPPPPPIPGPFHVVLPSLVRSLAALPMSTTTHYKVTVRTEDGTAHTFAVDGGIYDVAKPGATGLAEVWHGRIVRLRIGAHSDEQWSYWSLGAGWLVGWIGVMLVVGWGLPLSGVPVGVVIGGWWGGNVLFLIVHTWRPALWGVPLLVAGPVLLLRVFWTVRGGRRRYRSAW
jgi:hypothetical protein